MEVLCNGVLLVRLALNQAVKLIQKKCFIFQSLQVNYLFQIMDFKDKFEFRNLRDISLQILNQID